MIIGGIVPEIWLFELAEKGDFVRVHFMRNNHLKLALKVFFLVFFFLVNFKCTTSSGVYINS